MAITKVGIESSKALTDFSLLELSIMDALPTTKGVADLLVSDHNGIPRRINAQVFLNLLVIANDTITTAMLGSALARKIDVQGGVSSAWTTVSMWVQSDSSGDVELYAELASSCDAWFQGSFDSGTYTELVGTEYNAVATGWEDKDISGDIGAAVKLVDWIMGTNNGGGNQGVREKGSSQARIPATTVGGIGAGWRGADCMVNSNASGVIETYTSDTADDEYHCLGYFD